MPFTTPSILVCGCAYKITLVSKYTHYIIRYNHLYGTNWKGVISSHFYMIVIGKFHSGINLLFASLFVWFLSIRILNQFDFYTLEFYYPNIDNHTNKYVLETLLKYNFSSNTRKNKGYKKHVNCTYSLWVLRVITKWSFVFGT